MTNSFLSLGVQPVWADALAKQGISNPTPIQAKAIPVLMKGQDLIGQAQTGTGKTLAFVLPILQKIWKDSTQIQSLIVTPTRELALQITKVLQELAPIENIKVLAVYGGQDVERQMKKLQGDVQIVVGTPGRLLDHIEKGSIDLSNVSTLVLDEADQMLSMGFIEEVEKIINKTRFKRQTMLFSATMPKAIQKLAEEYLRSPVTITIESKQVTLDLIDQKGIITTEEQKRELLLKQIRDANPYLAMVFCKTKQRVTEIYDYLKQAGIESAELHGDLSQAKREQVMRKFRDAKIQVLVATDIAARGLDIEGITHVYNLEVPRDVETYIHRIGRTGRAGQLGSAVTFVSPREDTAWENIQQQIKQQVTKVLERKAGINQAKTPSTGPSSGKSSSNKPKKRLESAAKGNPKSTPSYAKKNKSAPRNAVRFSSTKSNKR